MMEKLCNLLYKISKSILPIFFTLFGVLALITCLAYNIMTYKHHH